MAAAQRKLKILDESYEFPPGYDFVLDGKTRSPWFDYQCQRRVSSVLVARELEIDYGGSSYQFFDAGVLEELLSETVRPALKVGDLDFSWESGKPGDFVPLRGGPLKLWCELPFKKPPAGGLYAVGCDVSFGSGASNSVASVVNRRTGEKVAEWASNATKPSKFAVVAVALARWFSTDDEPAMMIWESQGPGGEFKNTVIELGYTHFYRQRDESRLLQKETDKPGWGSSKQGKKELLGSYRKALGERRFVNRCREAILECEEYEVGDNDTVQHSTSAHTDDPTDMGDNHGDRVIADALANKLLADIRQATGTAPEPKAPVGSFAWRREQYDKRSRGAGSW